MRKHPDIAPERVLQVASVYERLWRFDWAVCVATLTRHKCRAPPEAYCFPLTSASTTPGSARVLMSPIWSD